MFVLEEKIILGMIFITASKIPIHGMTRYKSAKETSILGNENSGTW